MARIEASLSASVLLHAIVLAAISLAPPVYVLPPMLLEVILRNSPSAELAPPVSASSVAERHAPARSAAAHEPEWPAIISASREPDETSSSPPAAAVAAAATPTASAAASSSSPVAEPPRFDAAYLDNPQPAYPMAARRRGAEGTVVLEVLVDSAGRAASVKIAEPSGETSLDVAATEAVRSWRFVPARRGTESVEGKVRVPIRFRLQGH